MLVVRLVSPAEYILGSFSAVIIRATRDLYNIFLSSIHFPVIMISHRCCRPHPYSRPSLVVLFVSLIAQAHCFHASPTSGRTFVTRSDAATSTKVYTAAPHLYLDEYVPMPRKTKTPRTILSLDEYRLQYAKSIENPSDYWSERARDLLDWEVPFTKGLEGNLQDGDVEWFGDGQLNVCYNAVDRHAQTNPDKIAMIWEGDEPDQVRRITYQELQDEVSQIAHALQNQGVQTGDVVTIYMPMIPQLPMTMLACARLGAVHSVVFAGFSADALAARVVAASSKFVVTANCGKRGTKNIPLLDIVSNAETKPGVDDVLEKVLVWDHGLCSGQEASYASSDDTNAKHVDMAALVAQQSTDFAPVARMAEDPLFILYTSGMFES